MRRVVAFIFLMASTVAALAQGPVASLAPGVVTTPTIDTSALILSQAAATKPNQSRLALISATMGGRGGLKSYGIWSQCDVILVLAASDADIALKDWKRAFDPVAVNGPTFAADRGYTGDGATSRIRTNYTPSTNAVNLTQNNASAWVFSLTNAASAVVDLGNLVSPDIAITIRHTVDTLVVSLNDATADNAANTNSIGLFGASRTGSTAKTLWANGVQQSTASTLSLGVPAQEQWMLGANPTNFSVKQQALGMWCNALAGLQAVNYAIWLRYMVGVGAQ